MSIAPFLTALLAVLVLALPSTDGPSDVGKMSTYLYVFSESTADNLNIVIDNKERPFGFDRIQSDRAALLALDCLDYRLLYANSGKRIYVVGRYDAMRHSLNLSTWYIKRPFLKWDIREPKDDLPQYHGTATRNHLRSSDFNFRTGQKPIGFCPNAYTRD